MKTATQRVESAVPKTQEFSGENTSGLQPLGHTVLIMPYEPEFKLGVIELPPSVRGNMAMIETRAIVVEVGAEAWSDEKKPRAKPGDKVYIVKYAGVCVRGLKDNLDYRLVNDRDIYCLIVEE